MHSKRDDDLSREKEIYFERSCFHLRVEYTHWTSLGGGTRDSTLASSLFLVLPFG